MKFSLSIFIFIFSFPLISAPDSFSSAPDSFSSAPDSFSLVCDNYRGAVSGYLVYDYVIEPTFDGLNSNRINARTEMVNIPCGFWQDFCMEGEIHSSDERIKKFTLNYINDPSVSKIPKIDFFAKIPRNPITRTVWVQRSFEYARSSDSFHIFSVLGENGQTLLLKINRQNLDVKFQANHINGLFRSCNLTDSKKVDEIRKSILIEKKNFLEAIEEEEKRIKEKIKSSQKI